MPDVSIDDWADMLSARVRAAWPKVAGAVSDLDCALMGGTGVAMVLRHRRSDDLDVVTLEPFDHDRVAARLLAAADVAAYRTDVRENMVTVGLDGVQVQVFRDLRRVVRRGEMRVVAEGMTVDGLRVGSVPDLMATKLDAVLHRSEARDYVDIAEMDRSGACRIEDGLVFHAERYGTSVAWTETHQIADTVTQPPALRPDPAFDDMVPGAVAHLSSRRPEVMRWAVRMREQLL